MRTENQCKASRRAFMLMRISGDITMYKQFRDMYVRSYILKGLTDVIIMALERLQGRIYKQKIELPKSYLACFYSNYPQTDVKNECKESNQ